MRRLTIAVACSLALAAATGCQRGGAAPPPAAAPCDKTVDNCPPAPVAGQDGAEQPVSPPPGDPSQTSPATPPPGGRPPR